MKKKAPSRGEKTTRTIARTRASGKTTIRRRPKDRLLPSLEGMRITALDECAALVSDIREQKNDLRQQESEQLQIALNLMREHRKTTWRAHGVEFVRVPGEEKLRVRTSKEQQASAETDDDDEVVVAAVGPNGGIAEDPVADEQRVELVPRHAIGRQAVLRLRPSLSDA